MGQINRPSAVLFIIHLFLEAHILIYAIFIFSFLAEVSLSTPSFRLNYGLLSWSFNIDPVSMWRGAEWGSTRGVCSLETATKTVFQSQQLQTMVLLLSGTAPWWCNVMLVLSRDAMFHSRSVMRFQVFTPWAYICYTWLIYMAYIFLRYCLT